MKVTYQQYGKTYVQKVIRKSRSGKIYFMDNGHWMHAVSCKVILSKP